MAEHEKEQPRLFVGNREDRPGEQVLVTVWPDGQAEVAFRTNAFGTWGPPNRLQEHRVSAPGDRTEA